MADAFDVDAMIRRFKDRAEAVKTRPLPPVAGEERTKFVQQAKVDFQDYAIIGDASGTIEDGVLVLRVDLRPPDQRVSEQGTGAADPRFGRAIAAIDAANADDPNRIVVGGVERPKEQAHAELMGAWVRALDPDAGDLQLLAARAHHLRRWSIARTDYPDGRAGYLRWRTALKRQHAAEVAGILEQAGYGPDEVAAVQRIVRKEGLGTDPAVQVHEDALCLVFLETQFDELADKLGDDRTVEVLAKTLGKMSAAGIAAAGGLPLTERQQQLLSRALESAG